ncbi:hypothetical protein [Streptomyces griseorubiginosus]|uniref:Uncharacterized protein n=1 Tax=Streptomyces griseorubiginosus TaxID=67304 RepID=A0A101RPT6_9ACTN|nr:hypothetical protein [Streptomyces griseorubiginosus]KUN59493.1 hypothetical protein AQJ54_39265 [Streptomyces griseorubiginosus]
MTRFAWLVNTGSASLVDIRFARPPVATLTGAALCAVGAAVALWAGAAEATPTVPTAARAVPTMTLYILRRLCVILR